MTAEGTTETVTEAAPVSEAAPATPTPESTVEKIMSFDPFGPPEGDGGGDAAPKKTDEKVTGGDGSDSTAQPQDQKPPASPTASPEMDILKKQLKEANEALEAMKKANVVPPASKEPSKAKETPEQDNTPPYVFNIPDELVGKLQSEDPREVREGLVHYTAGVARAIHQTVTKSLMDQIGNEIAPKIVQLATESIRGQVSHSQELLNIRNDFYGVYKEFDKPELYPIVSAVAVQLAEELKVDGYSPEFREALANRLKAVLAVNAAQATPVSKPPTMVGGSGARGTPSPEAKLQGEILELM